MGGMSDPGQVDEGLQRGLSGDSTPAPGPNGHPLALEAGKTDPSCSPAWLSAGCRRLLEALSTARREVLGPRPGPAQLYGWHLSLSPSPQAVEINQRQKAVKCNQTGEGRAQSRAVAISFPPGDEG